ncbi:MAG: hypothetical protein DBY04_07685 [Clostridiales bacterium]|nr:MAG: hypothetical protein DBY04_07685 [Clostridiales bacterium]
MIYYIDRIHGQGDGTSPQHPRADYRDLALMPGDAVLFRRGTVMRERLITVSGTPGAPITYGAYGEGEPPCFIGSVALCHEEDWECVRPNVWRCVKRPDTEACHFIFDDGASCGTLRWSLDTLCGQGDFFDECYGFSSKKLPCTGGLYLWSEQNPAKVYRKIECAVFGGRNLADAGHDMRIESLAFEMSGVHGVSGKGIRTEILGCRFRYIGGCVWSRERKIRFGNAVEFWNICEDTTVENCVFDEIYDSCVTHQGGAECKPACHVRIVRNHFSNYGMAAYECRDRLPIDTAFSGNSCEDAGGGFSSLGATNPRNSEIYPEPMGHHIFIWRIPSATEGGGLRIEDNVFGGASGAAVYSTACTQAEAQIYMANNLYRKEPGAFFCRFGGKDYGDFEEYRKETKKDKGSVLSCFCDGRKE